VTEPSSKTGAIAPRNPAVIVASSHVVRGAVGNRSAVFALETLGIPVWAVPTVILPYHPGHGPAKRIALPPAEFAELLRDVEQAPWIGEVGAVLTGYLASPEQARELAGLIGRLKSRNRSLIYLCDPVIGDASGLYVPEAVAAAIRRFLLPIADIATPNLGELAWLDACATPDTLEATAGCAARLGPKMVVATSCPPLMRGNIGNLLHDDGHLYVVENRRVDGPANGAGDLFSALFLAHLLGGKNPVQALEKAAATLFEMLANAARHGDSELRPERDKAAIVRPMAMVATRALNLPKAAAVPQAIRWVGVDGCRGGWLAVCTGPREPARLRLFRRFSELLSCYGDDAVIAVDMPIGLPDYLSEGGRGPEKAVRTLLGERQSSVFSIPARAAIYAGDYSQACQMALESSRPPRKVSKQAYQLFPKIREIDEVMTPEMQRRVFEAHPEVAYWRLNGEKPMRFPKKVRGRVNPAGAAERRQLLVAQGFDAGFLAHKPPRGAAEDDLLDACACALIARRVAGGSAKPFPENPVRDERGLLVAIWA
jgi:pyridoxine kinase